MTESIREAQLKRTDAGLIPQGAGWFGEALEATTPPRHQKKRCICCHA